MRRMREKRLMICHRFDFGWKRKPLHLHAISFTTVISVVMILKSYSNQNGSWHLRGCNFTAWFWNASFATCPAADIDTNLKHEPVEPSLPLPSFLEIQTLLSCFPAIPMTANKLVPSKIQPWWALCSTVVGSSPSSASHWRTRSPVAPCAAHQTAASCPAVLWRAPVGCCFSNFRWIWSSVKTKKKINKKSKVLFWQQIAWCTADNIPCQKK